jgi:hypothetical protein
VAFSTKVLHGTRHEADGTARVLLVTRYTKSFYLTLARRLALDTLIVDINNSHPSPSATHATPHATHYATPRPASQLASQFDSDSAANNQTIKTNNVFIFYFILFSLGRNFYEIRALVSPRPSHHMVCNARGMPLRFRTGHTHRVVWRSQSCADQIWR